ncbi:bifunctional riboflavin kinase/FAD synthetase [Skermanella sp. TT6]|uniref:Riboflavin biosynthesis protein n=1 Tax=Skermanella cutis TaxID=2775420 RepID=A0ABX7B986_9PROT|nr:bifunctional riboflavin kinase/FAD synthetase [Skermanella sp. TT6]QQP90928.1 bifunctional riboflavin kinase/FAD synthetase [Skermanella sp. TT6]
MRLFRHYTDLPEDARGAVVALGNFDGVHSGHRIVIGTAADIARASGKPLAVLTFEPHPRSLFRPADAPFRLTPFRTKARHIEDLGVDLLFVIHFDQTFSQRTAQQFVDEVLLAGLGASHVVAGYDFVFGHKRGGDVGFLYQAARIADFGVTEVKPAADAAGGVFSSTRVRDLLAAGNPREAAVVLGRPWELEGRVEHGDQRGRTIGFPTANLELGEYLRPRYGVYAVRAGIDQGPQTVWTDGVANLGRRPTVDGLKELLEVHLFDFSGDLYGRHLRVQMIDFIRPERKFESFDALKQQILADAETARRLLAAEA